MLGPLDVLLDCDIRWRGIRQKGEILLDAYSSWLVQVFHLITVLGDLSSLHQAEPINLLRRNLPLTMLTVNITPQNGPACFPKRALHIHIVPTTAMGESIRLLCNFVFILGNVELQKGGVLDLRDFFHTSRTQKESQQMMSLPD